MSDTPIHRSQERLSAVLNLLVCLLFIFSSSRYSSQGLVPVFFLILLCFWIFGRITWTRVPKGVQWIAYFFLAVFLTILPNLFVNGGFAYDRFRSFNLPISYAMGAGILVLMVGLSVRLRLQMIFYAICLGAYVNGVIGFVQKNILDLGRVDGFAGIFEFADLSAAIGLCVWAYYLKQEIALKERIIFGFGFILSVLTIIYTESRGIMIAFFVACVGIFCLILMCQDKNAMVCKNSVVCKKSVIWKRAAVLLLACLAVLALAPKVKASLLRFHEAKTDIKKYEQYLDVAPESIAAMPMASPDNPLLADNSIGLRFQMWRESWNAFKISPIIGLNPKSLCELKYPSGEYQRRDCYQRLHSEVFNTLARKGILGLIALVGVWLSVGIFFLKGIKKASERLQLLGACVFGVLILYIIGGIGNEPMSAFVEGNFFLLFVGIFVSLAIEDKRHNQGGQKFRA
ncbi:hypothetical protein BKH46_04665 [Helicobacter sp. 12S02634-8]|uniref:O-antigen ligase family protein n=1 Tax=Helicobacter sp. 12S02634-8 TaxID=1476199 RepID=UPI000BA658FA|nr:O-antigen ligase family protein [Helicobacter sp. 12S02634-8]PAF47376.1 hypothetical protein BKH46_04665 [Helicobacter sp. 12S02634-8]